MKENFSNNKSAGSNSLPDSGETQALQKTKIEIDIYIDMENTYQGESTIIFTEDTTGIKHQFTSVANSDALNDTSFLVEQGIKGILNTTNNLRDCILRDPYFEANFDVEAIPRKKTTITSLYPLSTLVITSKKIGKQYDCTVKNDNKNDSIAYDIRAKKSNNIHAYETVGVSIPNGITLVNNPNFVIFENINETPKKERARIMINVLDNILTSEKRPHINIKIKEKQSKKEHAFNGVYETKDLTDNSFLIDVSSRGKIATAYNLKECLMRNSFFRNNYEILLQRRKNDSGLFDEGSCIELISNGYGEQYNCLAEASYGGVSAETLDLQNLSLNINYDYINISDEEDAILYINYTKGALKRLNVVDVKGVFELSEGTANYGEFLIVKPAEGMYTVEQARIATLQNIKETMLSISDIAEMFEIELNDSIGLILRYRVASRFLLEGMSSSKFLFSDINIPVKIPSHIYSEGFRYVLELFYQECIGSDSIDDGLGDYRIELDVYTDTGVEWGSMVDDSYTRGTHVATLSKSYFGKPLWFELNTLMSKKSTYSPLFLTAFDNAQAKWIDTGTMNDYRFVARRTRESNTEPIYMSEVLYTINGYDYTLNDSHLGYNNLEISNYTLDLSQNFVSKEFNNKVKPLTTNISRTHIIGQKQYLNYIIKRRDSKNENPIELALLYKLYTQSGKLIDEVIDLQIDAKQMHVMNTTELMLDRFLPAYNSKTVGQIDVCLIVPIKNDPARKYVEISENMTFRILPAPLHTVKDFAFLNRLGGWDSMNFGGSSSNEFKVTSSSIFKTLQPGFTHYTEIESVSSKSVEEKLTVQTSPIVYDVVEWLREMAASPAVYELSTRRYILIDDMSLKYSRQDDLFQIDLKYHYSDVFNGRMK